MYSLFLSCSGVKSMSSWKFSSSSDSKWELRRDDTLVARVERRDVFIWAATFSPVNCELLRLRVLCATDRTEPELLVLTLAFSSTPREPLPMCARRKRKANETLITVTVKRFKLSNKNSMTMHSLFSMSLEISRTEPELSLLILIMSSKPSKLGREPPSNSDWLAAPVCHSTFLDINWCIYCG